MLVEAAKQLFKPLRTCLSLPCPPTEPKQVLPLELGVPQHGGKQLNKMAYKKPAGGERKASKPALCLISHGELHLGF